MTVRCADRIEIRAIPGFPIVEAGDDVGALIAAALERAHVELRDGDALVVTSKVISRAEGRFVDVDTVEPSDRAREVGASIGKDPRIVELILRESQSISRSAPGVLVVRHRLGFISANAGIDCSNAVPRSHSNASTVANAGAQGGTWALLLPESPDASAERIRRTLHRATSANIGIVVSDSFGRPFRLGTVGAAIGVAGMPALWDRRGEPDLFGRTLEHTITALGDQVAAAADLVAGQAAEGRAIVLVRGLSFPIGEHAASELVRAAEEDLYA